MRDRDRRPEEGGLIPIALKRWREVLKEYGWLLAEAPFVRDNLGRVGPAGEMVDYKTGEKHYGVLLSRREFYHLWSATGEAWRRADQMHGWLLCYYQDKDVIYVWDPARYYGTDQRLGVITYEFKIREATNLRVWLENPSLRKRTIQSMLG